MAEIGEDNEPLIPSYLSRAKSASAHQLTLFLLVSSASFAHYLSVALSLPFSLSLSFILCPSPHPPSAVVYLSVSRCYFGAQLPRTNTPA